MIIDNLKNAHLHYALHPAFRAAFEYLANTDLKSIAPGRYPLDGENLFVILATDEGRGKSASPLEAHRKYIDIQYVIEGREIIGISPLSQCHSPRAPFDTQKDIIFFTDTPEEWITLDPGAFAILFPDDAHAPLAGEGIVRKAIMKIAINHD